MPANVCWPVFSQKMPTQTLRSVERDGLLTRSTRLWAQAHMDEVLARRQDYDTRDG